MTWQLWLAIFTICLVILALYKKLETRMVLLIAGLFMCLVVGQPIQALNAFVKGLTNSTLVPAICSVMGFAAVITATQCDKHLVALMAKPLKKLGLLLIPITTILTVGINVAIMSAAGTAACAGATFIPLLIRAGIRPAGAGAAVAAGTICGLMANPGNAHNIYVANLSHMEVLQFIAFALPYVVALVILCVCINTVVAVFKYHDHRPNASEIVGFEADETSDFKVNYLKAFAPLIPLTVLILNTIFTPKSGLDVTASMLIGTFIVALISLFNPGELTKIFFQGMARGFSSIIGLIVAAGVFTAGLQATGAVAAFIDLLKSSNDVARWGASLGPFVMALGTGSGEAATWAFNQAVTPSATEFGMTREGLGLLSVLAGQFGRTASPLAGAIIIVAGLAKVSPMAISKRLLPGMFVATVVAGLLIV